MNSISGVLDISLDGLRLWETLSGKQMSSASLRANIPELIGVFDALPIAWCLAGAHAVGLYAEPRATQDIDFIVDDRKLKRLLSALEQRFGDLNLQDVGAAVRLMGLSVDLIRAGAHPLFRAALDHSVRVDAWHVPKIEVLIALKFLSATSAWRGANRKRQDAVDLVSLYESIDADQLDRALLAQLAGLVYPGAARELDEMLARVDRGEPLTI